MRKPKCCNQEVTFYRELTGSPLFQPSVSKASIFHDIALHLVFKWLTGSLHENKESTDMATFKDLFPIWWMCPGMRCNVGIQFICHCMSIDIHLVANMVGYISVGAFITRIATHFSFDPASTASGIPARPLDRSTLLQKSGN